MHPSPTSKPVLGSGIGAMDWRSLIETPELETMN
jgi:hypothetical protein